MADNFGLKIGVEGEKEFRAALNDIQQSFKLLGSEMMLVTSQFDKNDKSIQALTSRNTVLNKEIEAQKGKIGVLKANLASEAIKAGLPAIVDMVKVVGRAVKGYVSDAMSVATAAAESQTLLTQGMRNVMNASDDEVKSLLDLAAAQEKVGVVSKTAQTTALAELASFVARKGALEDMLTGIGRNMGEGIGVGFEDAMKTVAQDMQSAIPTDFELDANVRARSSAGYGGREGAGGNTIHQNLSITRPKALSKKEAAREFRPLSQACAGVLVR